MTYRNDEKYLPEDQQELLSTIRKVISEYQVTIRVGLLDASISEAKEARIQLYSAGSSGSVFCHYFPAEQSQIELIRYLVKGYAAGLKIGRQHGADEVRSELRNVLGICTNSDGTVYLSD